MSHELGELVGWTLRLLFNDGYVVDVRLLEFSPDDAPHELVYDVLEVKHWGPLDPAKVDLRRQPISAVIHTV